MCCQTTYQKVIDPMAHLSLIQNKLRVRTCWLLSLAVLGVVLSSAAVAAGKAQSRQIEADFNDNRPIPHSDVSQSGGDGIVKAMLSCATSRYAHAVLGDAIEAGCLIVEDEAGLVFQLDLPENQVFEDLIPRIADVNSDGQNDVVLVRSEARAGAALAVYTLSRAASDKRLTELVATPPIGTAFRWLAPVGIADFNNDGVQDVAYVQTPHIGGILRVWSIIDGEFQEIMQSSGYSNHRIGDTRVSTAKVMDMNNDGVIDIALPDQRRRETIWLTLYPAFTELQSKAYDLSDFD